jgi:hypothetical protein
MSGFAYTSVLPPSRYEELANLMFFNLQQHRVRDDIVNAIERYGMPEIVASGHSLRFSVEKLGEVQTLYALEGDSGMGRLVGTLLYARVSDEKMVERLKRACKALKGVRELEILYSHRAAAIRI